MKKIILIFSVVVFVGFLIGSIFFYVQKYPKKIKTYREFSSNIESENSKLNWIGHWLNEHDREILVKDVATEFSTRNPEIDLNLNFTQNLIGSKDKRDAAKMYVDMVKNKKFDWDIVWLDDQIYQFVADELKDPYWGPKYLVNFGEIEGFKETQKDFIFDNPIWAAQTGGIIIGPMLEGYYHSLFYNKDLAEKIGLDIKEFGMTYNDFLGYVKAVDEYNKKNSTKISALYESKDWTCQEIIFQRLLKSEIGNFEESIDNKGSEKKNLAFKKTLEAFEELGKYNPLVDGWEKNQWFNTRQSPLNDETLFYANGIWMYNHWMSIDKDKTEKMVPAELPVFKKADFYQGGYIPTWAVWKDAPNKENAIKLMQFWATPQVAEKWSRYTMAPTGVKGNVTIGIEASHPFAIWQKKITDEYVGNIYYLPSSAYIFGEEDNGAILQDDLKTEMMKLLEGETTAQASYDKIIQKIK